ncbi:MAG: cytochrome c-type biogenesis protein [Pseudomonadota bacterium]
MRWVALFLIWLAGAAQAVEPGEVLNDPVLEARARDISQGLRCPVCQNESIDESDAPVARDLRLLVRERLVAGDSNDETMDFIVARYGEFVLLRPDTGGANLVLWLAGPLALIVSLGGLALFMRRKPEEDVPLSADEAARMKELLGDTKS